MGRPRSIARPGAWALLPTLLAASGCRVAPAKVWNLEQVHAPDGSPKRRANLRRDWEYLLGELFERTNFGGPERQAEAEREEKIEDPFGTCFENVLALEDCERDEKVAGLQAAAFAWLAVDCTYVLSRERCVLALGDLAQALDLAGAATPPGGEPATAEAVKALFDELVATVREVVAAPDLAGSSLEDLAGRVRALPLDRQGALRLLRATNALLAKREGGAVLAPLRALRLDLARRSTGLALRAAYDDRHGRVRAAALEAGLRAFPLERAALLRWAVSDPMEAVEARSEVSLRALQMVARYGLPESADEPPEELERSWRELLLQVLRSQVDGPHTIAACQALAKVTGQPPTILPEVWLARWRTSAPESGESRAGTGTNP
jgi:hypothetical protein